MATYQEFYRSLYRVSKGPRYEFWHTDSLVHKEEDDYYKHIWNACHTWEEKTCESIMKGLGKTPFIWGLRNQTRKYILERLSVDDAKVYVEKVPLPYLHGTCPEDVVRYELKCLFESLFEVCESVYGMFQYSHKLETEQERDLASSYHWLFPYCTMANRIRDTVRFKAREIYKELTGENYGSVLLPTWSVHDTWIPYEKRREYNILQYK
jgi:hypothetical protein